MSIPGLPACPRTFDRKRQGKGLGWQSGSLCLDRH